jgi:hypothetical protein
MSTDYQRSMQTASHSPVAYPVTRDILVVIALVLCLLAGSWASFHFCHTLLLSLSLGRIAVSFALFLLSTAKGLFHFLCGYWLARLLRRVNPWYVPAGLAVVAVLFLLVLAGFRPHADFFFDSRSVIPVPFLLAFDVFGENCLLLFLALGIWCQRRMRAVRGEGIKRAEVSTNAHLPSQTTDCRKLTTDH